MHFQGKKLRNELKYYVHIQEYLILREKLSAVLPLDIHSSTREGYGIRSLYFDGIHDHSLYDKINGIFNREKYRIRIYNESDQVINLERKSKFGNYIYKEAAPLSRVEYDQILRGEYDILRGSDHTLHRDFHAALAFRRFRPVAITDYEREAYTQEWGNVRITFDKRLAAGVNGNDLFDPGLILQEALGSEQTIMEVKFDDFLPDQIRRILQLQHMARSAISKYVICRELGMFQYKH
ncbi:polyphosphate polymerase domain-containing protein [Sporosarcina cyprini]|uniref:polyphosphate polymerase domain-containing protein n=1 Tax=Sporosarcina cyprini TaxID=2910523 RepID=UPI001EE152C3|nr:polyphosphate polymerase domain-containing protein [Sporosarcina cyprini]